MQSRLPVLQGMIKFLEAQSLAGSSPSSAFEVRVMLWVTHDAFSVPCNGRFTMAGLISDCVFTMAVKR